MFSSLDVTWVIFCAILVSIMQAGFCCLESGLVRAKNSINVAIKNLVDFCISSLMFSLIGFTVMFGETAFGVMGTRVPSINTWTTQDYTFFLFELTFCSTATTIVSGAVAERMSFLGYFITAIILSLLIYPVTGHWVWSGSWFDVSSGWLYNLQFHDFAGATVVHSVGGWMAFAAILIIGPRLGRFSPKTRNIDGHNLPTAVLGVFLLWFGWFGFNGGSTLAFNSQVPKILVNTVQGGAAGGAMALLSTWILNKRPQVSSIMNGVIGGLVSITAGCDLMIPLGAIYTGGIAGILCTLSTRLLRYYRIDDAVGVVPAHLVCGIWGTLAVALFSVPSSWASDYSFWQKLGVQSLGVMVVGLYGFSMSYLLLSLVNRIYPLRVTPKQERIGLNISEHGASNAIHDLLTTMNIHSLKGDFTQPVMVEPETDVASIADHYNRVLNTMNQIKADLNASQERLLMILNSPAFPVIISNPKDGTIMFINERAAELLGFTLQEVGRYREIDFWQNLGDRETFLEQLRNHSRVDGFETCMCKVDKTQFWSLMSGLEMTYDNQTCILFSPNDISIQREREITLRYLASTDSLTGVCNRRTFLEQAENLIIRAFQNNWSISVLMLDIDHFKQINDQFGHDIGDQVIQDVAHTCSAMVRQGDCIGRLGGEEFAILLLKTSLSQALSKAEKLRQHVEQTQIKTQSKIIQITISIGGAALSSDDTIETVLKRADIALYQAKNNGRNRVEKYWI